MKNIMIILCVYLFIMDHSVWAQTNIKKKADAEFEDMHYASAIEYYKKYLSQYPQDSSALFKMAISYKKINHSIESEKALREYLDMGTPSVSFCLMFAEVLAENGKYEESKAWYNRYKALQQGDGRGEVFEIAYSSMAQFYRDSSQYKVYFLDLNTLHPDFSPQYYGDGIVFCSGRPYNNKNQRIYPWNHTVFLDLYYINRSAFAYHDYRSKNILDSLTRSNHVIFWGNRSTTNDTPTLGYYAIGNAKNDLPKSDTQQFPVIKLPGSVNSKYHEGPLVFTTSQNQMYFTRNNYYKGKSKKSEAGINKLQLFSASKNSSGSWGKIAKLSFNDKNNSYGHPALSPDNKTLYLISDQPGGMGGTDLYKVVIDSSGNWGKLENLGDKINTRGNEMFPFIDQQGNLYFSSNGHGGLGGLDIFYAPWITDKFSKPLNMGSPINSSKDDFGFIVDLINNEGYFSSNRKKGGSDDDIYYFKKSVSDNSQHPLLVLNNDSTTTLKNKAAIFQGTFSGTGQDSLMKKKPISVLKNIDSGNFINEQLPMDGDTLDVAMNDNTGQGMMDKTQPVYSTDLEAQKSVRGKSTGLVNHERKASSPSAQDDLNVSLVPSDKTGQGMMNNTQSGYPTDLEVQKLDKGESTGLVKYIDERKVSNPSDHGDVKDSSVPPISSDCIQLYKQFYFDDIYYDFDKYDIRNDAVLTLDKLVAALKSNSDLTVRVSSHTDSRGSVEYNKTLSSNRSKAVEQYLQQHGISLQRIQKEFHSEEMLLNDCGDLIECADGLHQHNRRTEIFVIKDGVNITEECQFRDIMDRLSNENAIKNINDPKNKYIVRFHSNAYYVVTGVFLNPDNAIKHIEMIRGGGDNAMMFFAPEKSYYYVYVFSSTIKEEAVKKFQQYSKEIEVWLYRMN